MDWTESGMSGMMWRSVVSSSESCQKTGESQARDCTARDGVGDPLALQGSSDSSKI